MNIKQELNNLIQHTDSIIATTYTNQFDIKIIPKAQKEINRAIQKMAKNILENQNFQLDDAIIRLSIKLKENTQIIDSRSGFKRNCIAKFFRWNGNTERALNTLNATLKEKINRLYLKQDVYDRILKIAEVIGLDKIQSTNPYLSVFHPRNLDRIQDSDNYLDQLKSKVIHLTDEVQSKLKIALNLLSSSIE